jgi:CBS domain-containing protein
MILGAQTAADLMSPNPKSLHHRSNVAEAAAFLSARAISAAPVIDEAGRPIGVVSKTDILVHQGQRAARLVGSPEYYERLERPAFADDREPFSNHATVCDVMTPVVFCVGSDTPAEKVVEKMLGLGVRRLFVVDDDGILVGVVSVVDVLRKLRRWGASSNGHACA